jgi:hypothetical protein
VGHRPHNCELQRTREPSYRFLWLCGSPLNSSVRQHRGNLTSCSRSRRVSSNIFGFAVAGSPRLRARCCAARTRPTGLSPFSHFASPFRRPIWVTVAVSRLALPASTGAAAASGPHEITLGQRRSTSRRVSSRTHHPVQAWAGPGSHRFPFPCAFIGFFQPVVSAHRRASGAV